MKYRNEILRLGQRQIMWGLVIISLSFFSFDQERPRVLPFFTATLAEGQDMARMHNRVLFVFVCGPHCYNSHRMLNSSFTDTGVIRLYSNAFVCIRMNPDDPKNNFVLTNHGLSATPSFMYYSPDSKLLYTSNGYKDAFRLVNMAEIALRKINRLKATETKAKTAGYDGTIKEK